MYNKELNNRLKQLKIEDFIWIIYIGIIFMSLYSNTFERKYFIYNDLKARDTYRKITIGIFSILIVVYLYFLKDSYDSIKNLKPYDTKQKKELTELSFIGSLLITISGFIFFYIALKDEIIDVEIAFN